MILIAIGIILKIIAILLFIGTGKSSETESHGFVAIALFVSVLFEGMSLYILFGA
jgi:hypothetical protein